MRLAFWGGGTLSDKRLRMDQHFKWNNLSGGGDRYLLKNQSGRFNSRQEWIKDIWNKRIKDPLSVSLMDLKEFPANSRLDPNVALTLGHRLRRWPNVKPTLNQRFDVFDGSSKPGCHVTSVHHIGPALVLSFYTGSSFASLFHFHERPSS